MAQSKDAHYKKSETYYKNKDYKNALAELNMAMKADADNEEFLLLKGTLLIELEKYQDAFDTYTLAISAHPTHSLPLDQRAFLLQKIQQFDYALQDYDKALMLEKYDTMRKKLYVNRGSVKFNIRDFEGAYQDYMQAYAIDSMNIATLNNLATVCDEIGKQKMTLVYLNRIIEIDPKFIPAWGNIGFKYQEMGDYKKAIYYFDKVLDMDPNEALGFSNRAYNKYKLNELDGALKDVNKSLELYPDNSYAFKTRALIWLAKQNNKEACADIEKALNLGFTRIYGNEVENMKEKNCMGKY